ncbi:SymE family type I addiction module toxin [Dyadobacter pollutisoli]|jgi:toxic protein SymE|uniref:SymE family type I addiction module toxin n=1 Tax=Dyadobacter pollutisoli TaxID=2910158 RepID=A0A9E8N7U8_9BACT|nr:SymE family type I addiction module toxin [Dyadobacter pollutisoli]WAC11509.1 SymE family type I addiction module toxin [Dyadobacter pollutisoli]
MTHKEKISKSGEKQLKICSKYYQRENFRAVFFPEIRLAGKWLQDLGFECGEEVMVKFSEKKLEITLVPPVVIEMVPVRKRRGSRKVGFVPFDER